MAKDNWERFIDSCVEDDDIKKCKTYKEVNNIIRTELKKAYEGKASVDKILAIADDATESVCLRMGIPQE
jgi:hypothetical protein